MWNDIVTVSVYSSFVFERYVVGSFRPKRATSPCWLFTSSAIAQNNHTLSGTITDKSNYAIDRIMPSLNFFCNLTCQFSCSNEHKILNKHSPA